MVLWRRGGENYNLFFFCAISASMVSMTPSHYVLTLPLEVHAFMQC